MVGVAVGIAVGANVGASVGASLTPEPESEPDCAIVGCTSRARVTNVVRHSIVIWSACTIMARRKNVDESNVKNRSENTFQFTLRTNPKNVGPDAARIRHTHKARSKKKGAGPHRPHQWSCPRYEQHTILFFKM